MNLHIHDHTAIMLTERDVALLQWITRHGVVTAEHVAQRYFSGQSAAYRRLRKLIGLKLIRRDPTYYRAPFVIRVTAAGTRVAAVGVGPAALVLAEVRHSLALVDLTERLLAQHPGATLITEREFRAAHLRLLREGRPEPCPRIPDGVLLLSPDEGKIRVALELDLTPKRVYALTRVIEAYSTAFNPTVGEETGFSKVWWFVAGGAAERVRSLVHDKRADDFMIVREWRPPHETD